jgi:hypothetical protein
MFASRRRPILLSSAFFSFLLLTGAQDASATMADWSGVDNDDELEDALVASLCRPDNPTNCLRSVTRNACSSGCARKGYNFCFVDPRDLVTTCTGANYNQRLDIHDLNEYLKALSEVATKHPDRNLGALSFNLSLQDMLYHQIQAILLDPQMRYYDDALNLVSVETVKNGNHTVDPTRFRMVTWVNEASLAHAMTQADLGLTFLKTAINWALVGRTNQIEYYLRLSRRAFEANSVRVADGGVRNNKRSYRCHDGWYCYWFHSRDIEDFAYPSQVLNKHLYATRNALWAYQALSDWRDRGKPKGGAIAVPLPSEFQGQNIAQLREWARGGLAQLAYSVGNSSATPDVPPNAAQFLAPETEPSGFVFHRAYYDFDMTSHQPAVDTTARTDCVYHYYTLKVWADILSQLGSDPRLAQDADFTQLRYKVLYGRAAPDTRACGPALPDNDRVMWGVPVAELYMAGRIPLAFQDACDGGEPAQFQSGANGAGTYLGAYGKVREIFDGFYKDCLFW